MNTDMGNPNVYHPSPVVPSSNTHSSGRPNKKRRSNTMSSLKAPTQAVPAPLPTPTSATHPRSDTKSIGREGAANRARSPASAPSFSPPPPNNSSNNASANSLNLPFSPNFTFSPLPPIPSLAPTPTPGQTQAHPPPPQPQDQSHSATFDPMLSMPTPYDQQATPGAASTSGGSVHTDPDKDPFLSLLEQLAENEVSRGGPSELDYFLSGQTG
jgi:hypothetical protein